MNDYSAIGLLSAADNSLQVDTILSWVNGRWACLDNDFKAEELSHGSFVGKSANLAKKTRK